MKSYELVFKISNFCDPDPPTSQTDGHTDDMQSQYRALHQSAYCNKSSQRIDAKRWPCPLDFRGL